MSSASVAGASVAAVPSGTEAGASTLAPARALVVRNLRRIRRMPSAFVPSMLMPVFQAIAFSGAFAAAVQFAGVRNSLDWFVPLAAIQGGAFGGMGIGLGTIIDIQSGFFDRLRMAPMPRRTLIVGPLLSSMIRALLPVVLVTVVGVVGGMSVPGGALAFVMLVIAAVGIGFASAGWALGLAYRMRSMAAATLMQFAIFTAIFLSAAQMPLRAMSGWAKPIARYNPLTNVLRLARQGFLGQVTWATTWPGLLAIAGLATLTTLWARRGLASFDR